eukprot:3832199-Rhodomonas_salina.1
MRGRARRGARAEALAGSGEGGRGGAATQAGAQVQIDLRSPLRACYAVSGRGLVQFGTVCGGWYCRVRARA